MLGQNRFWMELHAFYVMLAMAQSHNRVDLTIFFGPRGDFQAVRQAFCIDDERVIPGGEERIIQIRENALSLMVDHGCFTVHDLLGPNDLATEALAYALMSQANTEQGDFTGEAGDGLQ